MCMHSCLNARETCMRICIQAVCLPKYVGMHACILYADAPVNVSAQQHGKQVCEKNAGVCVCTETVRCARRRSPPYLVLPAGGVRQVPSCYRPHNGFYKPGAGTGLGLSCRRGSPPLYPCRPR